LAFLSFFFCYGLEDRCPPPPSRLAFLPGPNVETFSSASCVSFCHPSRFGLNIGGRTCGFKNWPNKGMFCRGAGWNLTHRSQRLGGSSNVQLLLPIQSCLILSACTLDHCLTSAPCAGPALGFCADFRAYFYMRPAGYSAFGVDFKTTGRSGLKTVTQTADFPTATSNFNTHQSKMFGLRGWRRVGEASLAETWGFFYGDVLGTR